MSFYLSSQHMVKTELFHYSLLIMLYWLGIMYVLTKEQTEFNMILPILNENITFFSLTFFFTLKLKL